MTETLSKLQKVWYNRRERILIKEMYLETPFDFSKHSTIGCGGKAKQAYYPQSEEDLCFLLGQLSERPFVLGNMSNVLPMDEDTEKTVLCTKKMTDIRREDDCIFVQAGVTSGRLMRYLQSVGLGGVEFLAGIPCTMGGILFMNGGAGGIYISDWVESVRIYREGKLVELSRAECGYSYKESVFMHTKDVILGARLRLKHSTPQAVKEETRRFLAKRAHLPKGKSMGCVFQNPQGYTAGALIEAAGLKGLRIGGATVSTQHANFIINDQNATARDIRSLIARIKDEVWQRHGVVLEEEIRYL